MRYLKGTHPGRNARFHEKWEKENSLTTTEHAARDRFESLNSARARLCATCKAREQMVYIRAEVYKYVPGLKEREESCLHDMDPRTADGKDCPYYEVDEEALAEVTLERIKASEDEQIPS
jgi:hypothetical protein